MSHHIYNKEASYTLASGSIPYRLSNDYLFLAAFPRYNYVRKELSSSLLHLDVSDIPTVVVSNLIQLGESLSSKDFFLDLLIIGNSKAQTRNTELF